MQQLKQMEFIKTKKYTNIIDNIKKINSIFKKISSLNTSIFYYSLFMELSKLPFKDRNLKDISDLTGTNYNTLRKINGLFKADRSTLEKIENYNKTEGREGISAGMICRIFRYSGVNYKKVIKLVEDGRWNTSDIDDYFKEEKKIKEEEDQDQEDYNDVNELKETKVKMVKNINNIKNEKIVNKTIKKIETDKQIKRNLSIINTMEKLIENLNTIKGGKGDSFKNLLFNLVITKDIINKIIINVNQNIYKCNKCNYIIFNENIINIPNSCDKCHKKEMIKTTIEELIKEKK